MRIVLEAELVTFASIHLRERQVSLLPLLALRRQCSLCLEYCHAIFCNTHMTEFTQFASVHGNDAHHQHLFDQSSLDM